eukprot:1019224-Amphidinium_carterae.1
MVVFSSPVTCHEELANVVWALGVLSASVGRQHLHQTKRRPSYECTRSPQKIPHGDVYDGYSESIFRQRLGL